MRRLPGLNCLWLVVIALWAMGPVQLSAQDLGQVSSPILTIDRARFIQQSEFGSALAAQIATESESLSAENRRIEGELEIEERELTEKRKTMEAEAFTALADAFDAKVRRIREEQTGRARELERLTEERQVEFLIKSTPVLEQIMLDAGAAVIVEKDSLFLSFDVIDITDLAIQRVNETFSADTGDK